MQLALLVTLIAVLLPPASATAQAPARPPSQSVEIMPREVKLGRDRGFTAFMQGIEITDDRYVPFHVKITISSDSNLSVHTARFETEFGSFESLIPPGQLPRWQASAFGSNAPPTPDATLDSVHQKEERFFQLELGQAVWLARSKSLRVTVVGRLRERSFELRPKALKRLQDWLSPRVEARLESRGAND